MQTITQSYFGTVNATLLGLSTEQTGTLNKLRSMLNSDNVGNTISTLFSSDDCPSVTESKSNVSDNATDVIDTVDLGGTISMALLGDYNVLPATAHEEYMELLRTKHPEQMKSNQVDTESTASPDDDNNKPSRKRGLFGRVSARRQRKRAEKLAKISEIIGEDKTPRVSSAMPNRGAKQRYSRVNMADFSRKFENAQAIQENIMKTTPVSNHADYMPRAGETKSTNIVDDTPLSERFSLGTAILESGFKPSNHADYMPKPKPKQIVLIPEKAASLLNAGAEPVVQQKTDNVVKSTTKSVNKKARASDKYSRAQNAIARVRRVKKEVARLTIVANAAVAARDADKRNQAKIKKARVALAKKVLAELRLKRATEAASNAIAAARMENKRACEMAKQPVQPKPVAVVKSITDDARQLFLTNQRATEGEAAKFNVKKMAELKNMYDSYMKTTKVR